MNILLMKFFFYSAKERNWLKKLDFRQLVCTLRLYMNEWKITHIHTSYLTHEHEKTTAYLPDKNDNYL